MLSFPQSHISNFLVWNEVAEGTLSDLYPSWCSWLEKRWLLSLSPGSSTSLQLLPTFKVCRGRVLADFRPCFERKLLLDYSKQQQQQWPWLGTEVHGGSCWSKLVPGVLWWSSSWLAYMFLSPLEMGRRLLGYHQVAGLVCGCVHSLS